MGEKFDNIQQVFGRIGDAMEKVTQGHEAIDAQVIDNGGANPAVLELLKFEMTLMDAVLETGKALSSINAMLAVVSEKTGLAWMQDGPGIDMDQLAGEGS